MGIEALLTSQVIGLDAALSGKLSTSGGTVTGQLTNALGTITSSTPLTISQTWNNAAVTFNPLLVNVTDTQSASGSLLMDLQVGGTTKLKVDKAGSIYIPEGSQNGFTGSKIQKITTGTTSEISFFGNTTAFGSSGVQIAAIGNAYTHTGINISPTSFYGIHDNGNVLHNNISSADVRLYRDAAGTFAQRNSTNAQTFRIYNTYTSATSYENLQLQWSSNEARIGTSVGSAGGSQRSLALGSWNSAGTWRSAITITGSSSTEDTTLPNVGVSKINSISGWVAINAIGGGSFYTGDTNSASPGVFFVGTLINPSDVALTHRFAVDPVNNVVHIGGYRRAAAADGLLSASYAKGTDIAGSSLCISGGRGTGTGAGGSVRIQTAPAGSTGSSLNALVDRLTIDSTGAATFSGQLTNALGTITASTPLTISQTWNNAAVTFTGLKVDVVDTASQYPDSLLLDLSIGGARRFQVTKSGEVRLGLNAGIYSYGGTRIPFGVSTNTYAMLGTGAFRVVSGHHFAWSSSATNPVDYGSDIILARDAAGTLAQRDSTNAQTFRLYNTYTSSTSYENLQLQWSSNEARIGTSVGSAGGTGRNSVLGWWDSAGTWTNALTVRFNDASYPVKIHGSLWMGDGTTYETGRIWTNANTYHLVNVSGSLGTGELYLNSWNSYTSKSELCISHTQNMQFAIDSNNNDSATGFYFTQGVGVGSNPATNGLFTILKSGNIGIGTSSPTSRLHITETWNNVATTFTGILANVTDTASASGSLLMDLQVGGTSKFSVRKDGKTNFGGEVVLNSNKLTFGTSSDIGNVGAGLSWITNYTIGLTVLGEPTPRVTLSDSGVSVYQGAYFRWSSADLFLYRDAARTLALRDGVNANVFNIYNTYTSSTSYERAKLAWESNVFVIGTEAGSAGGVKRKIRISPASVDASSYIDFDCNLYGSRIISQYGLGLQGNNDARKSVGFCNVGAAGFPIIGNESYSFSSRCVSDKMMGFDPFHSNHDYEVGAIPNLTLRGHDCYASAVTNISGGHLYLLPGAGASASAGAANGGHVYLDGGQGYGTGVHGSIIIGNTRAGGVTMSATALSGSQATSLLSMTQTWNTTGTPTLIKANVTDTASASGSLLMDLQVGGVSKASIDKRGQGSFALGILASNWIRCESNTTGVSFGVNADIQLYRDAANTLAQRRDTNAQVFNIYNTYTSSTSYERGKIAWESNVLVIGTEKGSAGGSARNLAFVRANNGSHTFRNENGFNVFTQDDLNNRVNIYGGHIIGFTNNSDTLANAPDTGIARSSVAKIVLTDGSSGAGSLVFRGGGNIEVDTTTGTKIGTGTTQKIGFWNATPIVQPTTGVASATSGLGMGNAITDDQTFDGYTVAQIVKALRNIGLLA